MEAIPNPIRLKKMKQRDVRKAFRFFAAHFFVCLLVTAASAQSPATNQRLTLLRTAYEAAYQTEVAASHAAALTDLNAKYTAALDRALAAATQAGQLDTALALRDEKKRLTDATPLPADDSAAPETLKTLRLTYRSALASLELKRDQSAAPVKAKYDADLEALQTELTKAADLDGALAVKKVRTDLEQAKTPVPPKPTTSAPQLTITETPAKKMKTDLAGQVWENDFSTVYFEAGGKGKRVEKKNAETFPLTWEQVAPDQYKLTVPSRQSMTRLWIMNKDHTEAASKTVDGSPGSSTVVRIK